MPRSRERVLRQVLTVAQVRDAENLLISNENITLDQLIGRAGGKAGEWVRRLAGGRPVTVLCGPGNNGADGWVIAEYLRARGSPVQVVVGREPATDGARNAMARYRGNRVAMNANLTGDVLVDCLFGSGLTRALPDDLFALLNGLSAAHPYRIAIDLPSGVESDSGAALNDGLPDYALTLALGAWKHAHFAMPARAKMGAVRLADLGMQAVPGSALVLAKPQIEAPGYDTHKYRRGLLGIVGGAMPGAGRLAARAAQHAGAGYVKLAIEHGLPGVSPDLVVTDRASLLGDARIAAILVGPGLGRGEDALQALSESIRPGKPMVIDADALVLLKPGMLGDAPCVLTPHEGEMVALELTFGLLSQGLRHDRAMALARATCAVVVFKGADSLIAAPDRTLIVSSPASSWLSVAGTGDVLAGTIASRLAVHGNALRAAEEGLWLHGEAARLCGAAFTAGALAAAIRPALEECLA